MSKALGKIRITVVEAAGLAPKDGRGLNNPYAKVILGDRKVKTTIQKETNNPHWDESFVLPVPKLGDLIEINIFSAEKGEKGEFLGLYKVNTRELVDQGEVDNWYTLQKRTKRSNVTGKIHLKLLYMDTDKQDIFIDVKELKDFHVKSTLYVKIKLGEGKGKTSNYSPDSSKSINEDAEITADWSKDKSIVMPFDDTDSSIKFYLIDQDNRRAKLGIGQIMITDLKHDDLNVVWVPLYSLKKKDLCVAQLHVRVSIGDDIESMKAQSDAVKKSSKKSSKSGKSKKSSKRGSDDENDASDSDNLSDSDIDGSSSAPSSRRTSKQFSSSNFNDDVGGGSDEENEDEILSSMPANFRPIGKVLLEIREARNLVGDGNGKKDVVFMASTCSQTFVSHCIRQSQNPVWNEICSFRVDSTQSQIRISLRGQNETRCTLGVVTLDVWQFERETVSDWFRLKKASSRSDAVSGDVFITATYIPFHSSSSSSSSSASTNYPAKYNSAFSKATPSSSFSNNLKSSNDLELTDLSDLTPREGPIGTVSVIVMQASELNGKEGQLISSVKLSVDDGTEKLTPPVKGTVNPVWTHSFQLPVYKTLDSELRLTVLDNLRVDQPGFLGQVTLAMEQLAAAEEKTMERWFTLQRKLRKGKVSGRLRITAKLDLPRQKGDASLFSQADEVDPSMKYDKLFKVILIGESGVGKTGLFNRWNKNQFEMGAKSTIGSEISSRTYRAEKSVVKVQLWDTAGQERFRAITKPYYRGAMGAIVVFDITNKSSFTKLDSWVNDIIDGADNPDLQLLLIGNKSDLAPSRSVTKAEAKVFAEMHNMLFIETSALEKVNISRAFQTILTDIYDVALANGTTEVKDVLDDDDPNFKFDSSTGRVIVLAPEDKAPVQAGSSYCAC